MFLVGVRAVGLSAWERNAFETRVRKRLFSTEGG